MAVLHNVDYTDNPGITTNDYKLCYKAPTLNAKAKGLSRSKYLLQIRSDHIVHNSIAGN